MIERCVRFVPAIAWMALIFIMSSREQFPRPFGLSTFLLSIAAHLFLYGTLALLVLYALAVNYRPTRATQLAAVGTALLYGVTDELHQSIVPGRDASLFDLLVNAVGATIAVQGWAQFQSYIRPRWNGSSTRDTDLDPSS